MSLASCNESFRSLVAATEDSFNALVNNLQSSETALNLLLQEGIRSKTFAQIKLTEGVEIIFTDGDPSVVELSIVGLSYENELLMISASGNILPWTDLDEDLRYQILTRIPQF